MAYAPGFENESAGAHIKIKSRVHQILEATDPDDRLTLFVMIFISSLIVFSVVCIILESIPSIYQQYEDFFVVSEVVVVVIFTVEYVLRLWSITEDSRFSQPVVGRLRYAVTFFAVIDLLAILPFYLPMFIAFDGRFVRSLRLARLVRVGKLTRYSESIGQLTRAIRRERSSLAFTLFLLVLLMVSASCLMYQVESGVQPDKFGSIPDAMWWSIATMTTVGYGDVVPITPWGKLLGGFIAILGVLMIAMPSGIIASGFINEAKNCNSKQERDSVGASEKRIELLERLARLRDNGALTEDEFQQQKAGLLQEGSTEPALREGL